MTSWAATAGTNPLIAVRGQSRPLILVAPSAADPSVQSLAQALSQPQTRAAFADRQIIVLTIIAGRGEFGGRALQADETAAVLTALTLRADGPATTVLIGKDGGVKLREANISLTEVLATIDAMPMRRNEILRHFDPRDQAGGRHG